MPVTRATRGHGAEQRGRQAEDAACVALAEAGWSILARRLRTKAGEIDVVAARHATLAIVEVKARPMLADAAAAVVPAKRNRLIAAAEAMMVEHPDWLVGRSLRFDVIVVDATQRVRRIADAFREE